MNALTEHTISGVFTIFGLIYKSSSWILLQSSLVNVANL